MRQGKKILALTVAALASAGLAVGTSGAASASYRAPVNFGGSTWNCANGIYAGYCGTQKSNSGLYIAAGFGGQIIGTSVPLAFNAEFFWFKVGTVSQNYKYAEFAPGGVASNKVLADVRHHIVLATANGDQDQQWNFNGNGWTNIGTGDVLKATTDGGPIVAANTQSTTKPSEQWTFVTP